MRHRSMSHDSSLPAAKRLSKSEQPGVFQCTILRAFDLPKAHRDVFLLKDIQGYTLQEVATILGISIDTALARLNRARRDIGHIEDSDATERAR